MGKFTKYVKGLGKTLKEKGTVTVEKVRLIYNTVKAIKGKLVRARNSSAPWANTITRNVAAKVGKLLIFVGTRKELPI